VNREPARGSANLTFGALLHRLRIDAGCTQETLAERAGISVEAVSALERGVRGSPRRDTVERLVAALNLQSADESLFRRAAGAARSRAPTGHETPLMLPADPTPFVGRERERREVLNLLGTCRLITLTGPAGVGKTRLATAVAAGAAGSFPGGVYFMPLANVTDPRHLLDTIAGSLDILGSATGPIETVIDEFLDRRRALLLLDNFEQLSAAAPVIASLLTRHPHLTILVTSRVPLHLRSEKRFVVPPMSLPASLAAPTLDDLTRHDATELFLARWRATGGPDISDSETAHAIAAICARLDGLPLAIELAAARAAALSPQTLLARLTSRLKVLGTGPSDAPERQRTLRGALQWSYALLPLDRQALFRQLAVFAGGFTIESAETLCGDILDAIVDLVDANLLQPPHATDNSPRYSMLATIREYAEELLEESGQADKLRRRHAEYFTTLAEDRGTHVPSPDGATAVAQLRAEANNLRAALAWSCTPTGDPGLGLRLAVVLVPYWQITGGATEGRSWLDALLACSGEADHVTRARAIHAAGILARDQGDGAAWPLLETALAIYRESGDRSGTAAVLHALSYRDLVTGNYDQGIVHLEEALAMRRAASETSAIAESLGALSSMYGLRNDDRIAITLLEEAVALRRSLGDSWGMAIAQSTLGMTHALIGEPSVAEPLLREALDLQESLGHRAGMAISFYGLALVARQAGNTGPAKDLCRRAVSAFHETGNAFQIGIPLQEMALIRALEGDAAPAARLLGFVTEHEHRLGLAQSPRSRLTYDAAADATRRLLSDPEFEEARRAGSRLSLDQAVDLALS